MGMANRGPSELQLALKDVMDLAGMTNYLIINEDGIPLKWTGWTDPVEVVKVAGHFLHFANKSQQYYEKLAKEELKCIRLRTKTNEILISPGDSCIFIAFQSVTGEPVKEEGEGEEAPAE